MLDAPSDPTVTDLAVDERQTRGFELALRQWAAGCPARPTCPDVDDPVRVVTDLAAAARKTPIRSGRPGDRLPATDATVLAGVRALLDDDAAWPALDEALDEASRGDSGGLFEADESANGGPGADGEDPAEVDLRDANYVINCNDTAPGPTRAAAQAAATQLIARYPIFGRYGAWGLTLCQQWQLERHPVVVTPVPTPPLLVIGTVNDPATPTPAPAPSPGRSALARC